MSVASQLYHLQEFDTEIESDEQALNLTVRQLADRSVLDEAESKLASARQHRQELAKQQRNLETEIEDITAKLKPVEIKLYGGQVRNPKELSDLQREAEAFKAKRSQLEDKELEIMEQAEVSSREVALLDSELKKTQAEWQSRQQKLAAEMETLKVKLTILKQHRETLVAEIDPQAVAIYQEVKKKRGTAVATVEQGMCKGCRISLPVSEFQKAKTGALVRCGSCGRILYLA